MTAADEAAHQPGPDADGGPWADVLSAGSPQWARRLNEMRQVPPDARRAEMTRLAAAVRSIIHWLVNTDAPTEVVTAVAEQVEGALDVLQGQPRSTAYEGFAESANAGLIGNPYAFFDHSPMLGRANPLAPPIELSMEDEVVYGTVTFGAAYEGPPGCVHGGYIAAAFDEVLGSAQSLSGAPGMTGRLTVHYRSPTPLLTELRFEGRLDGVSGRKVLTKGHLYSGDVLCAEAEGLFISMDVERFVVMRQEREAQQRAAAEGER